MLRVQVQRRGHNHAVDIVALQQAAVVVERFDVRHESRGFLAASRVGIRYRDNLCVRQPEHLMQQLLPSRAGADHSHAPRDRSLPARVTRETSALLLHQRLPVSEIHGASSFLAILRLILAPA